jgi:hypothetical protein
MEFNQYQTEITEEILIKYPKEVIDDFYEHLNSIPFIQRLVSKERKRAKDMPKMDDGRIIVDLANPHILENMDYFRETAICFQENGYFTPLVVNKSTHSEFMQWFKRELIRCYYGMVRPDDGEWITGEMYFYLNYMVIKQTQVKKDDRGKKYVVRTDDFPEVWEGVYWRFHYIEQARNGGLYNNFMGQMHASEIASRGKGKSYTLAALLSRLFTIGISSESISKRKALIVADNKEYLVKDGTLNKFIDSLDFLNKHSEFPTQKHRDSMTEMNWLAGWKDSNKRLRGSQNEVLGVAISDDPDKARGKRPHPMHCSVLTDKGFIKWEDVKVGTVLYGDDGMPTSVIDIPFVGNDDIFKITLEDGRCTFAGKDHIFDVTRYYNDHNYFVHDNLTVSDIRKRMETEEYYIRNNPPVLFGDYDDEFCYDEYKKWLMKGALRYIPKKYLFGDFDLRYEMFLDIIELYGDSGHFVKTIHKEFINDLLFLARSIGYASYYNEETKYFIMYGKYDFEAGFTAIKSIEFVGNQKCKCVTVDNKSGLYLIDDFIITHNSDLMLVEEFGSFPKFTE